MTDPTDEEGVFVAQLTPEEYDLLGEGTPIEFTYNGAVIEQNPTIVIELVPTP